MDPETADQLVELNHRFYQSFATSFSETRQHLQPGVARLLEQIPLKSSILDLGCGGGTLAAELAKRGLEGRYLGLDFSAGLLDTARDTVRRLETSDSSMQSYGSVVIEFQQADLTDLTWAETLPPDPFDLILAFAVLHHIPGTDLRLRLLKEVRRRLSPRGSLLLSNWQFLNSERLRARLQPWSLAGINPDEVDTGDALLDWRRGGTGLRYAHQFSEDELTALAAETGYTVRDSFFSDGEGGNLGLYQIWVLN